jgi:hypothetical protein
MSVFQTTVLAREWISFKRSGRTPFPDIAEIPVYEEWFDSMYRSRRRFAKTIGLFAVLAIIISCIGILGLATFRRKRIKESASAK